MRDSLVIIVDDDAAIRTSFQRLLNTVGVRTEVYASGEDLLTAQPFGERCCMLVDYRLPGMNGLELLRRVAVITPRVPVVLVSGEASPAIGRAAARRGAVAVLSKPVSDGQLLECLTQVLGP